MQLGEIALGQSAQPGIRAGADDAVFCSTTVLMRGSCPTFSASSPPQLFPDAATFEVSIF